MSKKTTSITLALLMVLCLLAGAVPLSAVASGDNTSFASAAPIALDEPVTVSFNVEGQERYFKFTAPKDGLYTFQSSNKGDTDPVGTLYDPNQEELATDDDSGGPQGYQEDFLIIYPLSANQQVYIMAECYPGKESAHTGSYTLTAGMYPSMYYFEEANSYTSGQFTDVDENQWYGLSGQGVIATAFKYGLMRGSGDRTFNPGGNVTIAEAVTIAARVRNIYNGGSGEFSQGATWYQVYVDYAVSNGIIAASDFTDYNRAATRAEMAYIFSGSIPQSEFMRRNTVNSLPDVNAATPFSDSIITLYRAGIVTGSDANGTFNPGANITRTEAAAIISRVILPDTRVGFRTYSSSASGDPAAQADAGAGAVSMNALIGSWYYYDGWFSTYIWIFREDFSFVRLKASQTSYTNTVGTTWQSAYGNIMRGNYFVNGYTIECYNNQHSSQFAQGYNIGSVPIYNMAVSQLPPLSSPSNVEDFTMEFEFNDSMSLRLVCERPLYDDYDAEFDYDSDDVHNVTVPTHTIPSRDWPDAFTKVGIPVYGDGRVRYAGNRMSGDRVTEVNVTIDWSTPQFFESYITRLEQAGWTLDTDWGWGYDYVYEKNGYSLSVSMPHDDDGVSYRFVRISLWTEYSSSADVDDLFN